MRNLIRFLLRFRLLILFLTLQGLAFSWIFSSRSFQRSTYLNSSRALTGEMIAQYDDALDYLWLKEQNELLNRENARLRSLTKGAYLPLTTNRKSTEDTTYAIRYQFMEAQVINSSFTKRQNYMTINRGSLHGIKSQMGVIGPNGIVGQVKDVSPHFSTVIPIINPSLSISGRIAHTGFFGPVKWDGKSYREAEVFDIPRYANVQVGDTVMTDGRSLIYPPGIPIGTIVEYNIQDDKNFYALRIALSTDFASVNAVYVVMDKFSTEIQELENGQQP